MIINLSKKKYLARSPFYANGYIVRMRGMIGRNFADANFDAMVFSRCNCIHTFFMKRPLDVVFVRRDNVVCKICPELPPWRPYVRATEAFTTLELPVGMIAASGTGVGDVLDLAAEVDLNSLPLAITDEKFISTVETMVHYKANK